jgi:acetyl esterase/lipase
MYWNLRSRLQGNGLKDQKATIYAAVGFVVANTTRAGIQMNKTKPDFANITYASHSERNTMDVYVPKAGKGPFPVVLWIHGGAFRFGDKAEPQSLDALLEAGFAVASANYRFSSEAKWPAQLDDLKSALATLRSNAATFNINPSKVATFGASAGGHLSAWLALVSAVNPATQVKAAVDWFGPIDFTNMDLDIERTGIARATTRNDAADSPESELIGKTVKDDPAAAKVASPLAGLAALPATAAPPPFLIMHGEKDPYIGKGQSERLRDALQAHGGAIVEYHILPEGTHGGGDFQKGPATEMVLNFLEKNLK